MNPGSEAGSQPAARPGRERALEPADHFTEKALVHLGFLIGHARFENRVRLAVGHPFPVPFNAGLYDLRVFGAHLGVDDCRGEDSWAVKQFDEPPVPDSVPVVSQSVREGIRDAFSPGNGRSMWKCSGKHRRHGVNVHFLTDPPGELIWASLALPGSVHDLTAAPKHGIVDGLACWATASCTDKGYQGAGGAISTSYNERRVEI